MNILKLLEHLILVQFGRQWYMEGGPRTVSWLPKIHNWKKIRKKYSNFCVRDHQETSHNIANTGTNSENEY